MNGDQQIHEQIPNPRVERLNAARRPDTSEPDRATVTSAIPAIEFRQVDFSYDDKKVLDDLVFQVAKGEIKIILSSAI